MRKNYYYFLILPLFSGVTSIQAQEKNPQDTLETITVTATRSALPLSQLAGNTARLNQSTLEQKGHVHIQQSLSRIAGVNLARGNGQEYLPAVRSPILTGAGACGSILALADGIPLRAAGFCNLNELFDAQSETAAAIEVMRGPGTAFYGSNAMHGLINVISPAVNGDQQHMVLELGPDDFIRGKYSLSQQQKHHGFRADISASRDGGWQDDADYAQQKLNLRHEYTDSAIHITSVLSATNLNQETAGYISGKNAFSDPKKRSTNPNPEAFRDSKSLRWFSRGEYTLENGSTLTLTPMPEKLKWTSCSIFYPAIHWNKTDTIAWACKAVTGPHSITSGNSLVVLIWNTPRVICARLRTAPQKAQPFYGPPFPREGIMITG